MIITLVFVFFLRNQCSIKVVMFCYHSNLIYIKKIQYKTSISGNNTFKTSRNIRDFIHKSLDFHIFNIHQNKNKKKNKTERKSILFSLTSYFFSNQNITIIRSYFIFYKRATLCNTSICMSRYFVCTNCLVCLYFSLDFPRGVHFSQFYFLWYTTFNSWNGDISSSVVHKYNQPPDEFNKRK